MIVASLDIALNRPVDAVWTDTETPGIHHSRIPKGNTSEILRWVESLKCPSIIAIDAPSKKNVGRAQLDEIRHDFGWDESTYANYRVCEALLRQRNIGLYQTSQNTPAEWIQFGWQIYQRVCNELGYGIYDQPGIVELDDEECTLIEVHPHACFVVGLGWIPKTKTSLAGQLERIAFLQRMQPFQNSTSDEQCIPDERVLRTFSELFCHASFEQILSRGLSLPPFPHDLLDALAGLDTVIQCLERRAFAVGETDEGVIVLPKEPCSIDESYAKKG